MQSSKFRVPGKSGTHSFADGRSKGERAPNAQNSGKTRGTAHESREPVPWTGKGGAAPERLLGDRSVPTLGPSSLQTPAGTVGTAETSPQQPAAGGVPGYSLSMPYGGAPYPTSYPGAGYSPEAYNTPFQLPGCLGVPEPSPGYGGMTQSVNRQGMQLAAARQGMGGQNPGSAPTAPFLRG